RAPRAAWTLRAVADLEAPFARATALFAVVAAPRQSGHGVRARSLGARIEAGSQRVQGVLAKHERAVQRRDEVSRQLDEARARVARLDEEIAGAAETNEAAAAGLTEISAHIQGEVCPLCDRDFSEVSGVPLAAYVSA